MYIVHTTDGYDIEMTMKFEQPTTMGSFNDHWVVKRKTDSDRHAYCVRFESAPKNPSHIAWLPLHSDTATYLFRIRTQYSYKINFRCMQSKAESGSNLLSKIDCVVKSTQMYGILHTACCTMYQWKSRLTKYSVSMRYDEDAIKETTTAVLCRMLIFRIRHQSVRPCTTVLDSCSTIYGGCSRDTRV